MEQSGFRVLLLSCLLLGIQARPSEQARETVQNELKSLLKNSKKDAVQDSKKRSYDPMYAHYYEPYDYYMTTPDPVANNDPNMYMTTPYPMVNGPNSNMASPYPMVNDPNSNMASPYPMVNDPNSNMASPSPNNNMYGYTASPSPWDYHGGQTCHDYYGYPTSCDYHYTNYYDTYMYGPWDDYYHTYPDHYSGYMDYYGPDHYSGYMDYYGPDYYYPMYPDPMGYYGPDGMYHDGYMPDYMGYDEPCDHHDTMSYDGYDDMYSYTRGVDQTNKAIKDKKGLEKAAKRSVGKMTLRETLLKHAGGKSHKAHKSRRQMNKIKRNLKTKGGRAGLKRNLKAMKAQRRGGKLARRDLNKGKGKARRGMDEKKEKVKSKN